MFSNIESRQFVIADTHFNDTNIIRFCNRPFSSVDEMNKKLIENWNSVVSDDDIVWVLGDYFYFPNPIKSYTPIAICRDITNKLNGIKNLIIGNHDTQDIDYYKSCSFNFVSPYPILLNNFYLLSHEPLQLSETTPYFNIYGHVHNDKKYVDNVTSKCVSVERIGYRPLLLNNIISK